MNLTNAKKALIKFQREHESYLDASQKYQEYKLLPFWKKWFTDVVEAPRRNYLYECYTIVSKTYLKIELRMYFSGRNKEISLALNECNKGFKIDLNTGEKSYYLGRVNPSVSPEAEALLENIRKELAYLYVV